MPYLTLSLVDSGGDRPLVWLHDRVKSPPFSNEARREAGLLLRMLQQGESVGMPHSRPMPRIAPRCHELRITDRGVSWRIIYRIDPDAIVILEVFRKQSQQTPERVIDTCRARLKLYDAT